MFILLLNLFTLYTLHGIIIGYPPRLPQHATDDNRQVCKSKQHIHRPAERNLFCELVHPDAVDIPRSNNADKHRRGCHIEHIARQQFQYHARFRAVHLADGNLLAAQKHFCVYKAVGMSCLTTFFIESAQFILKTGVVDIDDFIVNTLGSLMGIMAYVILQQISFKNQKFEIHELIDISATMLPPMFIAFVAEMFLGDGSLKLLPIHGAVLLCYGIFVYVFLIRDFTRKAKVYYLACYVGIFCLSRVLL